MRSLVLQWRPAGATLCQFALTAPEGLCCCARHMGHVRILARHFILLLLQLLKRCQTFLAVPHSNLSVPSAVCPDQEGLYLASRQQQGAPPCATSAASSPAVGMSFTAQSNRYDPAAGSLAARLKEAKPMCTPYLVLQLH